MTGWRRLGAAIGGLVVVTVAATVLGGRVTSEQQAAARAAPPPAPELTAPVEQRALTSDVVAQGRVVPEREHVVVLRGPEGRDPVVSALPLRPGDELRAGALLAEVSGRPVIVLRGDIPAYRDLTTGDDGPDVRQLEVALGEAGFPVGEPDQLFDERTAGAVRALWNAAGYDPVTPAGDGVLDPPSGEPEPRTGEPVAGTAPTVAPRPDPAAPVGREIVTLPRNEIAFVPELPLRVGLVDARVGRPPPEEAAFRLHGGPLSVTSAVQVADRSLVEEGMPVALISDGTGQATTGVVAAVGPEGLDPASQVPSRPVTVAPDAPLEPSWLGLDVRLVVEVESSGPTALVVPVSGLRAASDGSEQVVVVDGDRHRPVAVTAGLASDGHVVVVPTEPGSLSPGHQVLVGR